MFRSLNDRAYIVGGAIRDEIMGFEPKDMDYAIACTEEEFRAVFPDAPKVGRNFPIFLINNHQVALTRTEKCVGEKYQDYEVTGVGVPIVEDLMRRDLTMNSMARHYVTRELIDPAGGVRDLHYGRFRATSPTTFSDDPLRILRLARLRSRPGFQSFLIPPDVLQMCISNAEKLKHITPERVELEVAKLYSESLEPSSFFGVLGHFHALPVLFPELSRLTFIPAGPTKYHGNSSAFQHTMAVIDKCKQADLSYRCFIACLLHDLGKGQTPSKTLPHHYGHEERSEELATAFFARNRYTADVQRFTVIFAKNHMRLRRITEMKARKAINFLLGIPRTYRDDFIRCCDCDHNIDAADMDTFIQCRKAIEETPIEVPQDHKDPHEYVLREYTKAFSKLLKGER